MPDLSQFHFIRPAWLWLLAAAPIVPLGVWLRERRQRRLMSDDVDPHLLEHLLVRSGRHRLFNPASLAAAAIVVGAIGIAGPAWEREPQPFSEDLAPLVVAIDTSWSMNAIDVPPTRLERAKDKLRTLLAIRRGARTALIAYAGTAHLVMPLTDDPTAIELFLPGIEPPVMPAQGKNPAAALALAGEILSKQRTAGSILFFTDGIPRDQIAAFENQQRGRARHDVLVLAVGTSAGGPVRISDDAFQTGPDGARTIARLDTADLKAVRDTGVFVASVTVDDRDVHRIARNVQQHLQAVEAADTQARWRDAGWYFVIPIAVGGALWFRKGWTVRWAAVVIAAALWPWPIAAQNDSARPGFRFIDLWLTRDQQGRYYFDKGDAREAANRFEDPMWKGIACYRAGDLPCAVDSFAGLDTAAANYDMGNALARQGKYALAVEAYDRALRLAPDHADAAFNRALVTAAMRRPKPRDDEQTEEAPDMKPDKVQFDDKGKTGKTGRVDVSQAEVQADAWLAGVQSDPGEFLRARFAAEAARAKPTGRRDR